MQQENSAMDNLRSDQNIAILLLVTQYEWAGAQHVAVQLANYLHQQGYRVVLGFFYDKSGDLSALQQSVPFPVLDLGARPAQSSAIGKAWATIGACVRLVQFLRQQRIQAILTFTHYSNVLGMPLAWLAQVPVRIASQRNTLSEFPAWFWRLDAAIVNSRLTSCMIAVSAETQRFCIEVEGMRPDKLVVIPNGVDLTRFDCAYRHDPERTRIRAALGIQPDQLFVLTIARLHPQKGHTYLIDAMPTVLAQHPQAHLICVGEGPLHEVLVAQIERRGLGRQVRLVGRRTDIPQVLAAADLFVLPSISEGMPNVVLEAMAAGTPVVATAVDGTRELIHEGQTGRLVAAQQTAPLARVITELLADSEQRERLAQAAHANVSSLYDVHTMYTRFEATINTQLRASRQRQQHRRSGTGSRMSPLPIHQRDRVRVLGVDVDALTVDELHGFINDTIRTQKRARILHANVHGLNLAYRDAQLRTTLNHAELVFCDGAGVQLAARILGHYIPERITYADWVWKLARFAAVEGHSLFLLGAQPGVAEAAAAALVRHAPGLRIVGTHHGYFDKTPHGDESAAVVATINAAKPDILIVSFGMPIQEQWLEQYWPELESAIGLTAGAAFDYASGQLKRGPRWMTDNGLEWLARMVIEPGRLWRRYILGNPLFLIRVIRQRIGW
jgi:N-acetylglucosaminyldiphosphoundecaprenol N-acetyl-beta-D-mannosaminyltransferase